jgi:hypothetical protein
MMPQISVDVLDVVRFLAIESKTYLDIRLNQTQKRKVKSLVHQSKKFLKKTEFHSNIQD